MAADNTTRWRDYIVSLKTANTTALDVQTLVRKDEPTVVAATDDRSDKNSQYFEYFTESL